MAKQNKLTASLTLSCDMDLIYVNSEYKVPKEQVMQTSVLFYVDGLPIDIDAYHVECKGITGAKHSIDTNGLLTIIFPEGCQVLKNSQIAVTAAGYYKSDTRLYKDSKTIKIMPVIKDEIIRLRPSAVRIKHDDNGKFIPESFAIRLEREFNGSTDVLNVPYKWYRITYAFSDDPYNEISYTGDYLRLNQIITNDRMPDHVMLNLYKDAAQPVPIQSIRIPIYISDAVRNSHKEVVIDLDNENDCVLTDGQYNVTEPKTIQTRLSMFVNGKYIRFKNSDMASVSIKTVDPEEEQYLKHIGLVTDVVPETGELAIKYKFPANIKIPKKIISEWEVSCKDSAGNQHTGKCTFNITAIAGMQSIYQLKLNGSVIRVDQHTKVRGPATLIAEKYLWSGNTHVPTDYGFILYSKDGGEPQPYEAPVLTEDVEEVIKFEYYDGQGVLMDEETLHVIYDGRMPIEADSDVVTSIRKFYLATNYDNSYNKYPLFGDDWIEDDYPGVNLWNEKNPYLWTYEQTIYVNIAKNKKETVTTKPRILQKYAKGIMNVIEYYYSCDMFNGIGNRYDANTKKWVVTKHVDGDTYQDVVVNNSSVYWDTDNEGLSDEKPALWNFTQYVYTENKTSETKPALIGTMGKAGANGNIGIQGCVVRKTEYEDDKTYYNDLYYNPEDTDTIRYIDVVWHKKSDKWFQVKPYTHDGEKKIIQTSNIYYTSKQRPAMGVDNAPCTGSGDNLVVNTEDWMEIKNTEPIKTPLIIATNAVFELAQGNEFLLMNDNNVVGGLSGYAQAANGNNIRIFVGTQIPKDQYKYLSSQGNKPATFDESGSGSGNNSSINANDINAAYNKSLANFRVYENGTLVCNNSQINGQLTNNSADSVYYTTIQDNEFLYQSKSGPCAIAMMPIKNPYTYSVPYNNILYGENADVCIGNRSYFENWFKDNYTIPALVFYDPSGNIGSWIDYHGLHVNYYTTTPAYHMRLHLDNLEPQKNGEKLEGYITDARIFDMSLDRAPKEGESALSGLYNIADGPVTICKMDESTGSDIFDIFDAQAEQFYIYPFKDYDHYNMLMDTQYTIETEYAYDGKSLHFFNKETGEMDEIKLITADDITDKLISDLKTEAGIKDTISSDTGKIKASTGINNTSEKIEAWPGIKFIKPTKEHVFDAVFVPLLRDFVGLAGISLEVKELIHDKWSVIDGVTGETIKIPGGLFNQIYEHLSAPNMQTKLYELKWDPNIKLSDGYKNLITWGINRAMALTQNTYTINQGEGTYTYQSLTKYLSLNGHILTLYKKRSNRSLYYRDSECQWDLATDIDMPITSTNANTIALDVSTFYTMFDTKLSSSIDVPTGTPGLIIDHYVPVWSTTRPGYTVDETTVKVALGIQLVTYQLYNITYDLFPYFVKFKEIKETGDCFCINARPNYWISVRSYELPNTTAYNTFRYFVNDTSLFGNPKICAAFIHMLSDIKNTLEGKTENISAKTVLNEINFYYEKLIDCLSDPGKTTLYYFFSAYNLLKGKETWNENNKEELPRGAMLLPTENTDLRGILYKSINDSIDDCTPSGRHICFRPQIIFENGYKKEYITMWAHDNLMDHIKKGVYIKVYDNNTTLKLAIPASVQKAYVIINNTNEY